MAAIEVVSDQKKKTAMSMDEMKKLHQSTYEAGAMVRLGLNNILMSPPLVISEAEIDQILDALDYGFHRCNLGLYPKLYFLLYKTLKSPGFNSPKFHSPIDVRISRSVGNPILAVIRRTCLFSPL